MRYRRKVCVVEGIQWDGTNERLLELTEWGASVTRLTPASSDLHLYVVKGRAKVTIHVGDYVMREPDGTGFYPCSAEDHRLLYVPDTDDVDDQVDEVDPFPRAEHVTLTRVGFGRPTPSGDGSWEWRHGGLTRTELDEGGWVPLYDLRTSS